MSTSSGQTERTNGAPGASGNRKLLHWAATLSTLTVVAHAIDAPDHLSEWWGYATFFIVVAAFQFFYGLALFLQPWRYDERGGISTDANRSGRSYYVLGIALAASVVIVYLVSRITGLPFLGPQAAAEPFTVLSLVPVIEDLALLYCLTRLLLHDRGRHALAAPGE